MAQKVHFIGVGGIGVSALAQYYLSKGAEISGSDLASSEITDLLEKKGVIVKIGEQVAKNVPVDADLVVYSPAVKKDNPEFIQARNYKIKTVSYPEALGQLTKEYFTIAISGAHGKSTTTAMIALILIKAGLDPTVIVGTKVKEFNGSNFREGKSNILVIEACEYDSSFLHYFPKIAVVTNVDKEHLDYFKTFAKVKKAFKDFILKLPKDGSFVFCKDEKFIPKFKKPGFKVFNYSLRQKDAKKVMGILKVPGKHNVLNALAALQVARVLEVNDEVSFEALSNFTGVWRRFDVKEGIAQNKKITLVSDYGHHPNEILATLRAAREKYLDRKIWCVFQPHQHQRTYYLFKDFVKVFRQAPIDKLIITDIYDVAGRETKMINNKINSEKLSLATKKKNIVYMPKENIITYLNENVESGQVLIIMGAGDIYHLVDKF